MKFVNDVANKNHIIMKKFLLFLITICGCSSIGFAQDDKAYIIFPTMGSAERNFEIYRDALHGADVAIEQPATYKPINMEADSRIYFFMYTHYRDNTPYAQYATGLESSDGNAAILFPGIMLAEGTSSDIAYIGAASLEGEACSIAPELRSAYRDSGLDVVPLVDIIVKDDMSQYANADTAAIYSFSLDKIGINYMDKYNKCIGVYLRKAGHPALLMKLMLTDEGYKNKDKYLKEMLGSIKYGDKTTALTPFEANKKSGLIYRLNQRASSSDIEFDKEYDNRYNKSMDELRIKWKAENDSLNRVR